MTIMSGGAGIDKARSEIKTLLKAVKSVEVSLIKAGCLKAYIHWKPGKDKAVKDVMYMNEPANEAGVRPYHHVGKKPERQAEALALVAREEARDLLERERTHLAGRLSAAEYQLSLLENTFNTLRREAEELEQLSNEKTNEGGRYYGQS